MRESLAHEFNLTIDGEEISAPLTRQLLRRVSATDEFIRIELEELLQLVLLDYSTYLWYLRHLAIVNGAISLPEVELSDSVAEQIIFSGLSELSDSELRNLAINSGQLMEMFWEINETDTEAWQDIKFRVGEHIFLQEQIPPAPVPSPEPTYKPEPRNESSSPLFLPQKPLSAVHDDDDTPDTSPVSQPERQLREFLARKPRELLTELGQVNYSVVGATAPSAKEFAENGKRWLKENNTSLRELICRPEYLGSTDDEENLFRRLKLVITKHLPNAPGDLIAALIMQKGLHKFCEVPRGQS